MDHAHHEGHSGHAGRVDKAAGHGMVVLGLNTVFFYHLPMFMSPHDYQVIFEGTLAGSDLQRAYREDRKKHADTRVYTLAPAPFVLTELFPPTPTRKTIQGDLFRGHFERPPEYPAEPFPIGTGVDVAVVNVVFVQKLLPLPKPLSSLEYVLFGKGTELFLAHLITKKGDFDQVMSAGIKGPQFDDDELRKGVRIQFTGKANTSSQRLVEGQRLSGSAQMPDKTLPIEVEPRVEFYMSERDLT